MLRFPRALLLSCLAFFATTSIASASLIVETFSQFGTGLGAVNTILTIQDNPNEQGCVSFGGVTGSVLTAGVCTGSSADVKTGPAQTQTRTLAQAGITSAANFSVVLNGVEPSGDSLVVDDLRVAFYNSTGTLLFQTSGLKCQNSLGGPIVNGPCTLSTTNLSTGPFGYVVLLDAAQQTASTASG